MASVELWSDVMFATQAAVGRETQPIPEANEHIGLLWVLFMVGMLLVSCVCCECKLWACVKQCASVCCGYSPWHIHIRGASGRNDSRDGLIAHIAGQI
eukprot:scaffold34167_cov18-Tisochrysis_lutea.AAC.2